MSKSKKEEEGFKTVDRRKSARKKTAGPQPTQPDAAATPRPDETATVEAEGSLPEEEARTQTPPEQIPALDAFSVLRWCIGLLSAQAWQWMGLVASPLSGEVKKDPEQARLSIDSVAALVERLSPKVEPAERRELENLVSNLRLNFVSQSQPAGPSPGE